LFLSSKLPDKMPITTSLLSSLPVPFTPPAIHNASLPPAQSADVVLVPASDPEYVQTAYLNGAEWKGPLTMEQYLEREVDLQTVGLTKDGRITGWMLTSNALPTNPDGTRPILSSCESIRMSAYVARDGRLQKIQAHGVASVYTRPEHRGKGYAGRMMADLAKRLESWQEVNGQQNSFSVLYSDIGQKFYAQFGWKPFESTHIHLSPLSRSEYEKAAASFPAVQDLSALEIQSLPTTSFVEEELRRLSAENSSVTFTAISPDEDHFEWHHAREEYLAKILGKDQPSVKGAIHRDTGLAVIWSRRFAAQSKDWQLTILHTAIPSGINPTEENQRIFAALLLRSQLEAADWDMAAGVEIWDPPHLVLAAAQLLRTHEEPKVEVITRDKEHICSLRWTASQEDKIVWTNKQEYAWC
jgi:GNAT superfamily N-acetyltransferase